MFHTCDLLNPTLFNVEIQFGCLRVKIRKVKKFPRNYYWTKNNICNFTSTCYVVDCLILTYYSFLKNTKRFS